MITCELCGETVSMMGMGCMRLPVVDGDPSRIDEAPAREMVARAYERGITYFDTAWAYHKGTSEAFMGRALSGYPRDSFVLATKFPSYDTSNFGKHKEIFEAQLKNCQVDYFDFYLLHNVNEANIDLYLQEDEFHTVEYFLQQKKAGRIKHLGFSQHCEWDAFARFMNRFGSEMEFCQIELNYLDWDFQDAKRKVRYCQEHDIPMIVMEPLRGGQLANLSERQRSIFAAANPDMASVEWAYRWLQGIEGVAVVLSGSSTLGQMEQNIACFAERRVLTTGERKAVVQVADCMAHVKGLPCTGCRYCLEYCPQSLDIPMLIGLYNEYLSRENGGFIARMRLGTLPEEKRPAACIACNGCQAVCPQGLTISEFLAEFAKTVPAEETK